ncbi:MAG: 6-bladed beta-propeller [Balneolaceae bacterium]
MKEFNQVLKGALIFAVIVGCHAKQDSHVSVDITPLMIEDLELFLDFEEKGIVQPEKINFLSNNRIMLFDPKLQELFVFNTEKELLARFGGKGNGPGELNRALHINISQENILVVDAKNYRLNEFDVMGNFKNSKPIKDNPNLHSIAAITNNRYYTESLGEENSLIKLVDLDENSVEFIGKALGEKYSIGNLEEERQLLANNKLPEFYKNVASLYKTESHLYVFLDWLSRLQKYDLKGKMIWDKEIYLPINKILFERVVERAKNAPEGVVPSFSYILNMKVINNETYLFWSPAKNQPRLLVKVDEDGNLAAIYHVPEDKPTYFDFTIDHKNNLLYLTAPELGQVFQAYLPE